MGQRRQSLIDRGAVGVGDRLDLGERQTALGDRPGLVDAQHVDSSEHLDRRKFLHEASLACEAYHTDGEGNAGEQHEALRHHADQTGDGADDRLPPALVAAQELAARQQQTNRDDEVPDPLDDPVDVVAQRRVDQREPSGFLGEFGGVVLGAHLRHQHAAGSGDHGTAAEHVGTVVFHHRVCLAGEQRLVDLQVLVGQHCPVGHHLRAGAQLDHVVEHQLVRLQFDHLAVAHDVRPRRIDDAELVEHLLGPEFLDHTDRTVGDDHSAEQRVLRRAGDDHQRGQDGDDEVDRREDVAADDLTDACESARSGSCWSGPSRLGRQPRRC